ncbi:antibiotic biosynthesis monooxygenase [Marinomonas agarivorans]|nr:antibiotic biosynthesis monooxygenase [Marinomonas agarivorans]
MIAREWKARLPLAEKDGFLNYLDETGVKETSSTPGFRGAQVLVRDLDSKAEVTLITYWSNLEVIKAFSGKNISKAKLYPEDEKYKLEPDTFVNHYEVVENVWS